MLLMEVVMSLCRIKEVEMRQLCDGFFSTLCEDIFYPGCVCLFQLFNVLMRWLNSEQKIIKVELELFTT